MIGQGGESWGLDERIADARRGFTGRHALYAKNLDSGAIVAIDAELPLPTASVIKIAIMAVLYQQIDRNAIDPAEILALRDEHRRYGTGVLRDLQVGTALPIADLCRLMIVLSDNTATRMIARRLGIDAINETIAGWGFRTIEFRYQSWTPPDPREYAVGSVEEIGILLERLVSGSLLSEGSTQAVREHLARQQDHSQLPRWLPYHEYAEATGQRNDLTIMNKTGQMQGVRTDAAAFELGPARWIVVSFTYDSHDRSFQLDHEGIHLNARIGRAIYDAWANPGKGKE